MLKKIHISSSVAWVTYLLVLFLSYAATAIFPALPFLSLATQLTLGFIGFLTNRHLKRRQESPVGVEVKRTQG